MGRESSLSRATRDERLGLIDMPGSKSRRCTAVGDFAGEPFDEDSREYVCIVRRRPAGADGD